MSTLKITVPIKRLSNSKGILLPEYQSEGAAGMDIHAAIENDLTINSGAYVSIPCGFSIAVPNGYEAQIRPRSGLAVKHGISILNSPGTIDSDYRGEVKVLLINFSDKVFNIVRGTRIAQMLILPVQRVEWIEVNNLSNTVRGEGGFGHTGS